MRRIVLDISSTTLRLLQQPTSPHTPTLETAVSHPCPAARPVPTGHRRITHARAAAAAAVTMNDAPFMQILHCEHPHASTTVRLHSPIHPPSPPPFLPPLSPPRSAPRPYWPTAGRLHSHPLTPGAREGEKGGRNEEARNEMTRTRAVSCAL